MSDPFPPALEGALLSRKFLAVVAGSALGGVFVALALGFLALAAYLALLDHLPPWQAALSVAAVSGLIAWIALALSMRLAGRTVDRVKTGIKTSAVALVAPRALHFAARNLRLTASLVALVGALLALLRARSRPENQG
ncbi:hypothetical protein [uncultured Rhodoblastus sp.]|uniref:hypothetical protein n=1 Tax=uncultured Rhodoblastus sp. TaxID=543037 RepID=UPI0025E29EF8|nr:hypothetical protein [uncultured Rhodoblastus sp.]